ncbi:unnamed protein product [Heligmosomoides polygyrus]|uniref:Uncharacterized protein n=1 Tax=Heligmosomoides polygyrus TaxID=6339 RepID=A0A183F9B0_HELPZ|nr:unnamed protein product [Heligmosomoides polygyrus]
MIMANEDEKGRVPVASPSKEKPISARDPSDDEKGALLEKQKEAAEKLNPSKKAGEVRRTRFLWYYAGRLRHHIEFGAAVFPH